MKLSELKRAYDITNPTQAQKDKMLDAILSQAPGINTQKPVYSAKQTGSRRWSWIPAAAMLVIVAAAAVFLLGPNGTQISFRNSMQLESESLTDFFRSDFYRAAAEWYEYVKEYEAANNTRTSEADGPYHCRDAEMAEALNALCGKYGLSLYDGSEEVGTDSFAVFLKEIGVSDLFRKQDGVEHSDSKDRGCWYDPYGNFSFSGMTSMNGSSVWTYPIEYSYYKAAKTDFHPAFWKLGPIESYDYWEYKTQSGQELLLAMGTDGALILLNREAYVIFIKAANYQRGDIDRAALEAFAETFDFSLTPAAEEDSDIMESMPEDYLFILQKYQTAVNENWQQETYDQNDISRMPMYLDDPATLGFCLMDLDGNGYEELIVGAADGICDVFTYNAENGVMHILCAGEIPPYALCEGNIIKSTSYSGSESNTFIFYRLTDGVSLIPEQTVVYKPETHSWYAGVSSTSIEEVTSDTGSSILASYPEVQIDYIRFITENAPAEKTETLDPAYAMKLEHYVKAVEEDWTPEQCTQNYISYLASFLNSVDEIGYTLIDLDGDGTEEMIISDGKTIYDLYTIVEDEVRGPLWVCSSGERLVFTLGEDHRILFRGSSGAANTEYSIWSFVKDQLVAEHILLYDAAADPEDPWFYKNEPKATEYPIPEEDANTILELFTEIPIETRDILRGTAGEDPAEQPASQLFESVFIPAARGEISCDLESFRTVLDRKGYSCYEEEGILYADDPENPGSYLYGVLSNETGTVEIFQLGYCLAANGETREVHTIFFSDGIKHYLNIPSGKGIEVQQAQSLEELREFLGIR